MTSLIAGRPFPRVQWLPFLLLVSLMLALLAHVYIGHFSRYMADDFCLAADVLQRGALEATVHRYYTWTGRLVAYLLLHYLNSFGPGFVGVLPAILTTLWLAAFVGLLYSLLAFIRLQHYQLAAWLLGTTIILAIVDGAFSTIQSLYWSQASIPYTLPLIALTVLLVFFMRIAKHNSKPKIAFSTLAVIAMIALINGGFSETYTAFQVLVFALLAGTTLLWLPSRLKRPILLLSTVVIVGSLIALAIMLAAPGNALRQAATPLNPLIPRNPPLPILIVESLKAGASSLASIIGLFSPLQLLITLVVSVFVFYQWRPETPPIRLYTGRVRKLMALSALFAFGLNVVCMAPSIYGASVAPSERVYIIPQYVIVATTAFWGALVGLSARKPPHSVASQPILSVRLRKFVLAIMLLLGPIALTWKTLAQAPQFATFASDWDARDQQLRTAAAQGVASVEVPPLSVDLASLANLETAGPDPGHWVNSCMARYYSLESLVVQPLSETRAST